MSDPAPETDPINTSGLTADSLIQSFAKTGQLQIPGLGGTRFGGVKGVIGRFLNQTVSQGVAFAAGFVARDPMQPLVQDITNETWALHPSQPLRAHDAAALVERGEFTMGEAIAEGALTGYNAHRMRMLDKLAGLAPNSEQLTQMYRRGVISLARMREGLVQGSIRSEWADDLIKIANDIPSVSAMVRFAVREAYGGGSDLSGTSAEAPGGFLTDVKRHGLAEQDAIHFWAAHWQLPSPTQMYTMLHRGLIGMGTVLEGLRVSDYPPFWRDKLASIAYHVPGRIDLRRMLEHDVIDEARVLKGYKDLGYDDENAAILTQFAVELAKPKAAANPHKVNWADRALSMAFTDVHGWLKKGDMTEAQAAGALAAAGIPDGAAGVAAGIWAAVLAAHEQGATTGAPAFKASEPPPPPPAA